MWLLTWCFRVIDAILGKQSSLHTASWFNERHHAKMAEELTRCEHMYSRGRQWWLIDATISRVCLVEQNDWQDNTQPLVGFAEEWTLAPIAPTHLQFLNQVHRRCRSVR